MYYFYSLIQNEIRKMSFFSEIKFPIRKISTLYLVVDPKGKYEYDALYRLTKATGREHASTGQTGYHDASSFSPVPRGNNSNELRNYVQQYQYDD